MLCVHAQGFRVSDSPKMPHAWEVGQSHSSGKDSQRLRAPGVPFGTWGPKIENRSGRQFSNLLHAAIIQFLRPDLIGSLGVTPELWGIARRTEMHDLPIGKGDTNAIGTIDGDNSSASDNRPKRRENCLSILRILASGEPGEKSRTPLNRTVLEQSTRGVARRQ
jgi:hypothetical protein